MNVECVGMCHNTQVQIRTGDKVHTVRTLFAYKRKVFLTMNVTLRYRCTYSTLRYKYVPYTNEVHGKCNKM